VGGVLSEGPWLLGVGLEVRPLPCDRTAFLLAYRIQATRVDEIGSIWVYPWAHLLIKNLYQRRKQA